MAESRQQHDPAVEWERLPSGGFVKRPAPSPTHTTKGYVHVAMVDEPDEPDDSASHSS